MKKPPEATHIDLSPRIIHHESHLNAQAARLSRLTLWSSVFLLAVIFLVVMVWRVLADSSAVSEALAVVRPYLAVWRLLLFTLLIGGWHRWVNTLTYKLELDHVRMQRLYDFRWRLTVWLLIIEMVLVQHVPEKCWAL